MIVAAFVLSAWLASATPIVSPCLRDCEVSEDAALLVRKFEGYYPFTYKDPVGLPTIGYGHQIRSGDSIDEPLMGDAADKLLWHDLRQAGASVNRMVHVPLYQHQFDALSDITFNVGPVKLQPSGLLRAVNEQRHDDVPAQFMRWVYAGGVEMKGLVSRRRAEADLYTQGMR